MKSDEFKKILKPLIRQTIKEVLLEDGVLSKVVSEVARGLQHSTLVETKQHIPKREENIRKEEIILLKLINLQINHRIQKIINV